MNEMFRTEYPATPAVGGRWLSALNAVVVLFLLTVSMTSWAQVYRWTDAEGKVHFSDSKPPKGARDVSEVGVGETNVVPPFQYRQKLDNPPQEAPQEQPPGEVVVDTGRRTLKSIADEKSDCAARKAAYEGALACFAECGRTVGALGNGTARRNNSNCGHCADLEEPKCSE